MFFAFINFCIGLILVYSSFSVDRNNHGNASNGSLVNLLLFLAVIFFAMGGTIALCVKEYFQFALFAGRISYMLMGWFSVLCCNYLLLFPNYRRGKLMSVMQAVWFVFAAYIIFVAPNAFSTVSLQNRGLKITSGIMFKGNLSRAIPCTWLEFFNVFYGIILPCFCVIMSLVRAENVDSKLLRQNMVQNALGVVISCFLCVYISKGSRMQPALSNFMAVSFIAEIYFFVRANVNYEIVDARAFFMGVLRFLVSFALPLVVICAGYVLFVPLAEKSPLIFKLIFYVFIVAVISLELLFQYKFRDAKLFRRKKYSADFEKDIVSIDFSRESAEITKSVFEIFNKYVESSSMRILIDDGVGSMTTVYASDGNETLSIPINQTILDSLLNNHNQIIFREDIDSSSSMVQIKGGLTELLDKTSSDAMIMLNEGRQFIGFICLGKKLSGNIYSEYDMEVFNKFYSNLFVIGYYVKNIMNEAVVGTVNREIRMSGQIITSIQENMDLMKSKKVDVGYLMTPARSIGGEFVDMIRLTDTRHIFVIGALSGKGIAASMGMVILKSIIRTFLSETTDFKLLVAKVNDFIRESLPKGTFFAGTFGLLDFSTNTMYYINCGIPAIFVYTKAYNNVIEVQGEGHILGFVKDVAPYLKVKKVNLAEGDIVMITTDGMLDTKSLRGDIFGKTRTQNALMENSNYPATKMAKFAYDALVEFTSKELENDVTILVMKYLGNQA